MLRTNFNPYAAVEQYELLLCCCRNATFAPSAAIINEWELNYTYNSSTADIVEYDRIKIYS